MPREDGALQYCPDLCERIERLRSLYERRAMDRVFAVMGVPRKALAEFAARYASGPCECPPLEERVRFWDSFLSEAPAVEDDRIPAAYMTELDQGLYGGLLGGKATFMAHPDAGWISSMVAPMLAELDEMDRLHRDEHGEWARRYADTLSAFVKAAQGKFGISHFILIDGLNFVYELVGATKTYMALDERPELVRRAINAAFSLNAWVQDRFFEAVPLVAGGTCSNMASWVPGRVVSESVDPFHLTSAEYYARWGREAVERILSRYDGGVVHLHSNGMHLIEAVCATPGVRAIRFESDGDSPPLSRLTEISRRSGDMPLIIECGYEAFLAAVRDRTLAGGAIYDVSDAPDARAATECMERVRDYRAVS